jgi:tripartite-type tricarboxylate transporter receptor subunit TctC
LRLTRRTALAALASAATAPGWAQPSSSEVAKIVVGFPPGGASDVAARLIADRMRGRYAPSVIVDNKPGAAGRVAAELVKNAAPDGQSILLTPGSTHTVYPYVYKKLPYHPEKDFIPVTMACSFDFVLAVGPKVPESVRTVADFVRWCKANPQDAAYASAAMGSLVHFVGAMFAREAGIQLVHVPYKGGAPAMQDLMGGQIASSFLVMGEALPHLKGGRLRLIASSGAKRSRLLPELPTFREAGLDLDLQGWFGFFVPARTPAERVNQLASAIAHAQASPEVAEGFAKIGYDVPPAMGPRAFAARVRADDERWRNIVKLTGFTPEE